MPLVFVPTPLGNLRDITLRALDVLREATLVVAEDSRVARRLLSAYELPGREIWTYHEHNADTATTAILERARAELVAVVTDAGMPGISDPGSALVAAARSGGVAVEVLPGATAFTCAAVLSGFDLRRFTFAGFPPRSAGERRSAFRAALARETTVWYESPHRIHAALDDLASVEPAAEVFLVRELSKLHEQQVAGTPQNVAAQLEAPVRGEIVFVVAGRPVEKSGSAPSAGVLDDRIAALLAAGLSTSAIAKTLADEGLGERRDLYARVGDRRRAGPPATEA